MYYYSSNYLIATTTGTWPPAISTSSIGTTTVNWVYLTSISGEAQSAMGFRQWVYTVVIGGCQACAVPPNPF